MSKNKILPVAIATLAIGVMGLAAAQTVTDSSTHGDSSTRILGDSMDNESTATSRDEGADDVRRDSAREADDSARVVTDSPDDAFDDADDDIADERMARSDRN